MQSIANANSQPKCHTYGYCHGYCHGYCNRECIGNAYCYGYSGAKVYSFTAASSDACSALGRRLANVKMGTREPISRVPGHHRSLWRSY